MLPLGPVPRPPDEHGQHLAVLDTCLLQCLDLVAQWAAIQEEMLRVGGEASLGLDEALKVLDGEAQRQVQSQQLLVSGLVGRVDGYGDAWPI